MPLFDDPYPLRPTTVLGIDPGAEGGISVLINGAVHKTTKVLTTPADIWFWLGEFMPTIYPYPVRAYIEQVGGFMAGNEGGEQKNIASGHTMFNFGKGAGYLEMALVAAAIPYELVPPQRWQKGLQIVGKDKSETKTQWKNRLKSKAQQLFPAYANSITLAVADAILIAEYGRRKLAGIVHA